MHLEQRILKLLPSLAQLMLERKWKVAIAESCTGGGLASRLTSLPGSSKWFDYSLVTYSNKAKMKFLRVSTDLLEKEGAVSEACALAMVKGLSSLDDFRLSITGFAGPDGEHVGEVFIAWQAPDKAPKVQSFYFYGTREQIITQVVYQSLRQMVLCSLGPLEMPSKCFFAVILDDPKVQNQCLQVGLKMGYLIDELEPLNNLHMTLSYLGKQSLAQINYLKLQAQKALLSQPFEISLKKIEFWKRADALVLTTDHNSKQLKLLHDVLGHATNDAFRPHVTIAKGIKPLPLVDESVNISFQIKNISLMLSYEGVFYIEYARWHLSDEGKK